MHQTRFKPDRALRVHSMAIVAVQLHPLTQAAEETLEVPSGESLVQFFHADECAIMRTIAFACGRARRLNHHGFSTTRSCFSFLYGLLIGRLGCQTTAQVLDDLLGEQIEGRRGSGGCRGGCC